MGRSAAAVAMVVALSFTLLAAPPTAQAQTLPADFIIETIADVGGAFSANAMAFVPGEDLVAIGHKEGRVELFGLDGRRHGELLDLTGHVNSRGDRGLTGIAFPPDMDRAVPGSALLYLWYVWDAPQLPDDSDGRRLSRLTTVELTPTQVDLGGGALVDSWAVVPGSETVVLGAAGMADPANPTSAELDAALGADPECTASGGTCYPECLADGDTSNDAACTPVRGCDDGAGGYLRDCLAADHTLHNAGTIRFTDDGLLWAGHGDGSSALTADVRAVRALRLDSLNGKVMRLDPATGEGVADNPFATADLGANRSLVVSGGFRNPFRFSIHRTRGDLMVGDVGWSAWEEVNTGIGTIHGWPCLEGDDAGNRPQPIYVNLVPDPCQGIAQDPSAMTAPLHAYAHEVVDGQAQGAAAIGGDYLHGTGWPRPYQDGWFYADLDSRELRMLPALRDGDDVVIGSQSEAELFASDMGFMVDIQQGPDDQLWVLEIGSTESIAGSLRRISFTGDNPDRSPVVSAIPDQLNGLGGRTRLRVFASDPDGLPVTFTADPANPLPPGLAISSDGLITGTPTQPGTYTVTIVASDGAEEGSRTFTWVVDTDHAPRATILTPTAADTFAIGDMVAMTGEGTDVEDGDLTGTSLEWDVEIRHADHIHPDEQTGTGNELAPFWITDHGTDWYLVGCLRVTDSAGHTDVECVDMRFEENRYTVRTDPPGLDVTFAGAPADPEAANILYDNQRRVVWAPLTQAGLTFVGWNVGRPSELTVVGGATQPLDLVARYADVAAPTNLGATATATQSSTHTYAPCGPHSAQRALDGNTAGREADCSISHTGKAADQWWEADLGATSLVEEVAVWNWTQHSLSRLSNGWVLLSTTPMQGRSLDSLLADPTVTARQFSGTVGRPTTFVGGVRARYVRVMLPGPARELVMSEVEIIGTPLRPPLVTVDPTAASITAGNVLDLDASDALDPDGGPVTWYWDDGLDEDRFSNPVDAITGWDSTNVTPGTHTLTVEVTDADGQVTEVDVLVEVLAPPPEPPVASLADPGDPVEAGTPVPLDASASTDPEGGPLTFAWDLDDDGDFDDATGATTTLDTTGLAAGPHPVAVRVTSTASTLTDTATAVVGVVEPDPTEPPVAVLADPGGPFIPGEQITLDAAGSTDPEGGPLVWTWDLDGDGSFTTAEGGRLTVLDPGVVAMDADDLGTGTHPVAVRVTSSASGRQATAADEVTVHGPPVAAMVEPAGPFRIDGTVTLDASPSTEPQDAPLTFEWDVDGDGTTDPVGDTAVVTFDADMVGPGVHHVLVTAISTLTGLEDSLVEHYAVRQPPQVVVGGPAEVVQGQQATLSADSSYDPEGGALAYGWDLDGDGVYDDAAGVNATLDATGLPVGPHLVAVRATSSTSGLTGQAALIVTVVDAAAPPHGGGGGGGGAPPQAESSEVDLLAHVRVSPATAEVGTSVDVIATVSNLGPATAPAYLTVDLGDLVLQGSADGCTVAAGLLTCEPVDLGVGESTSVSVPVASGVAGAVEVVATAVSADVVDRDPTNDSSRATVTFFTTDVLPDTIGGSPTEVAIQLSQHLFDDADTRGGDRAAAVVLSRDDAFADSLTGSVLLGGAPLLFTGSTELAPATLAEVERILPPGGEVILLGGTAAISAEVEDALIDAGFTTTRLAGPSRVETAVAIAAEAVERFGDPRRIGIARAGSPEGNPTAAWADSVAAGGWAARTGWPILLTPTESLHPAVAEWLDTQPGAVPVLLGGPAAVSEAVGDAIGPHQRDAGSNRYATAATLARSRWDTVEGFVITAGDHPLGWAYGLASAALSARTDHPLLLVETGRLPQETAELACGADLEVIGGTDVVGTGVRQELLGC